MSLADHPRAFCGCSVSGDLDIFFSLFLSFLYVAKVRRERDFISWWLKVVVVVVVRALIRDGVDSSLFIP